MFFLFFSLCFQSFFLHRSLAVSSLWSILTFTLLSAFLFWVFFRYAFTQTQRGLSAFGKSSLHNYFFRVFSGKRIYPHSSGTTRKIFCPPRRSVDAGLCSAYAQFFDCSEQSPEPTCSWEIFAVDLPRLCRRFRSAIGGLGHTKSNGRDNHCFCVVLCLAPCGIRTFRFANVYICRLGVCGFILTQKIRRSDVRRMGFVGLLTIHSGAYRLALI